MFADGSARPPLLPAQLWPRLAVLRRAPLDGHARQRPGRRLLRPVRGHRQGRRRRRGDDPARRRTTRSTTRRAGLRFADGTAKEPAVRSRSTCACPAGATDAGADGQRPAVRGSAAGPAASSAIDREWKDGDTVRLTLPMQVAVRNWRHNADTVSVDRGPLTYSLKIGEKYVRDGRHRRLAGLGSLSRPRRGTTAWCSTGADRAIRSRWSSGVAGLGTAVHARGRADRADRPRQADPRLAARRAGLVRQAAAQPGRSRRAGRSDHADPDGRARLRIASFPVIGEGPDAIAGRCRPSRCPIGQRLALLRRRHGQGDLRLSRTQEFRRRDPFRG